MNEKEKTDLKTELGAKVFDEVTEFREKQGIPEAKTKEDFKLFAEVWDFL